MKVATSATWTHILLYRDGSFAVALLGPNLKEGFSEFSDPLPPDPAPEEMALALTIAHARLCAWYPAARNFPAELGPDTSWSREEL